MFWYNGEGEYLCDNGTPLDKLENGVFQLNNFTPNGNMELAPGEYKILVYVGNGDSENYQETLYYSTEVVYHRGCRALLRPAGRAERESLYQHKLAA